MYFYIAHFGSCLCVHYNVSSVCCLSVQYMILPCCCHVLSRHLVMFGIFAKTSSLIYQATVTRHDNSKEESYIGLTDNTFKTRYNGHTSSFRNEQYRNATTLSNYIWTLKDKNINYSLKWKIIGRGRAYQPSGKNCSLCDLEKFYIISRPELASLNQRNELATTCRHRKKHLLYNK